MNDCEHYQPGEEMGKERPVCRYYRKGGVCTSGKEFMCKLFIEKWLREHPIETMEPEYERRVKMDFERVGVRRGKGKGGL